MRVISRKMIIPLIYFSFYLIYSSSLVRFCFKFASPRSRNNNNNHNNNKIFNLLSNLVRLRIKSLFKVFFCRCHFYPSLITCLLIFLSNQFFCNQNLISDFQHLSTYISIHSFLLLLLLFFCHTRYAC